MIQMVRVTSKYQITIPNEIREAFKVEIGDRIIFRKDDSGEMYIRTVKKMSSGQLSGALHRKGQEYTPLDAVRRIAQEEIAGGFSDEGRDGE